MTTLFRFPFLSALALLLLGCQSDEPADTGRKPRPEATSSPTYEIGTVSRQSVGHRVQLPGEFRAYQEISIYPRANGFVERVLVDRGSSVRKGQVLMEIDAPEAQEQLVAARSKVLRAEALLVASREHYRRLRASSEVPGSVSALDLETAEARVRADSATVLGEQASYRALSKIESYLTVRAPFDGVITERNVHPGALVGAGANQNRPMLILQQQTRLRLVVDVPEAYTRSLRQGQEIAFTVSSFGSQEFRGKISRRSGSMNQQFRSETVEIDVPNATRTLMPGMFAEIALESDGSAGALSVPPSAVLTTTERQYVVKVDGGRAVFVDVRRGQQAGDRVEVFGSLRPDDAIVLNPRESLKEGAALQR
jgi:membrane fusion protein (multidrug efflux system)